MSETQWGPVARMVGLDENASARTVAALHGMVLAPGASARVEIRGPVLLYPEHVDEITLRAAVAEWVGSPDLRDPAESYVSLRWD